MSPSRSAASGPPFDASGAMCPTMKPCVAPGEAAVGDQRDRLAQALADDRRRDVQHLAHPGPAVRALVADHDDVARADRACLDGGEARPPRESNTRAGPRWLRRSWPASLTTQPSGCEVAERTAAPPRDLIGVSIGTTTVLTGGLDGGVCDLAERLAVDRGAPAWTARLLELARDEPHAAGPVHVVGVPAAPGLHVGEIGVAAGDPSKSSIVNWMPKSQAIATRWRTPFVEPPVATTDAAAFSNASLVTIETRRHVVADEIDDEPSALEGGLAPCRGAAPGSPLRPTGLSRGTRGSSTSCWR